ncbi:cell division protein ZapD [Gayadomonas joobiniege]|uniref:cell division protein ZapD n=1 Tax=Gayadomonas joobiniege TaxID=1234606 RepID=UPI0003825A2A|nr:cell division protein ZapD [Gayadomonas joobiniege]
MADLLYEFPLNEKIRTYLRVETLVKRAEAQLAHPDVWAKMDFLNALFALLDVVERGDLKSDLLKDLEKHEKQLVLWSQHPGIDNTALQATLTQLVDMSSHLANSAKLGQSLRDDRFLSPIKQRFAIPGGNCCFDLPNLHQWLHQNNDITSQDQQKWLKKLEPLKNAVILNLKMLREKSNFETVAAVAGAYQKSVDSVELLRLKLPLNCIYYPTVSGHKSRFSIRFMQPDEQQGKSSCEDTLNFELAIC